MLGSFTIINNNYVFITSTIVNVSLYSILVPGGSNYRGGSDSHSHAPSTDDAG